METEGESNYRRIWLLTSSRLINGVVGVSAAALGVLTVPLKGNGNLSTHKSGVRDSHSVFCEPFHSTENSISGRGMNRGVEMRSEDVLRASSMSSL
jgi:hypothetical protein